MNLAAKAWFEFFGPTTSAFFITYLTSLEVLFQPPSSCIAKGKLGLLLRGQTNAGGVDIISLLGGLILHAFLAPSPLASRCESVGDVLALLCSL
jgi:hypothetical protein